MGKRNVGSAPRTVSEQPLAFVRPDGTVLFVSDGISNGRSWFTCYRKSTGSRARYKSPRLPERALRRDAVRDLIAVAQANGWKAAEVCEICGEPTAQLTTCPQCERVACVERCNTAGRGCLCPACVELGVS